MRLNINISNEGQFSDLQTSIAEIDVLKHAAIDPDLAMCKTCTYRNRHIGSEM